MLDYYTIDTGFGKNIVINTNEGTFVIWYEKDSDISWHPIRKNYQGRKTEYRITQENESLYNTFNELYEELANYQSLFDSKENIVNWYSDEETKEEASLLQMYKEDKNIKIVFNKNKDNDYGIKIKNHDNKCPANKSFIKMYNTLAYQNENYTYGKHRVLKK